MAIISSSENSFWGIATAYAQSPTATLGGTIVDETDAVVPDVKITVFNLATALQRRATTDENG